jgi:hypothetical protein
VLLLKCYIATESFTTGKPVVTALRPSLPMSRNDCIWAKSTVVEAIGESSNCHVSEEYTGEMEMRFQVQL